MASYGPAVTVELEQARLNAAVKDFLARMPRQFVDVAVRKMSTDILATIVRSLNGVDGLPKRIDTGRLRGAWRTTAEALGAPVNAGGADKRVSGDASHTVTMTDTTAEIVVTNNVEYARYVEDGTATMAPGHHVKRALAQARADIPTDPDILAAMQSAWEGE